MRYTMLCMVIFFALGFDTQAQQDSTKTRDKKTTKYGQYFGFNFSLGYAHLRMKSVPYYVQDNGQLMNAAVLDGRNYGAGIFFQKPNGHLRVGLDLSISTQQIKYRYNEVLSEFNEVYSFYASIPVIYQFYFRPVESKYRLKAGIGVRAVFPMLSMSSDYPTQQPNALAGEISVGWTQPWGKIRLDLEAFYNPGLTNIHRNTDNWRDHVVQSLYLDVVGVRMFIH